MVVIPLAAFRLAFFIQEHAMLAPHLAVEKFHPQHFPAFGMLSKICPRLEEMPIIPHLERQRGRLRGRRHGRLHAPLPRLRHHQSLGSHLGQRARQLPGERLRVPRGIELRIIDLSPKLFLGIAKVAHRRQKNRDPRLACPDVLRFLGDLCHPDHVALRIKAVER